MTVGKRIRIAGPQSELRIGPAVEHARTHLFVRQRVMDVVQDATPRRGRRPAKATSKWPGTLSTDVF